MGIERVEMILFYVYAQTNNVRTDRSPPPFYENHLRHIHPVRQANPTDETHL